MRQRINKAAICSSANYAASKRVHKQHLEEAHASFCAFSFSTSSEKSDYHPKTKTIMVFGKPMVISYEEYLQHSTLL